MAEEDAEAFLKRMTRRYRPPRWLAGSEDNTEEALDDYRRSLSRYDGEVLDRAWHLLVGRHRFWSWPSIVEALEVAEQARREINPSGKQDWAEEATRLADEYVKRFMKSAAATRATAAGYGAQMKAYAEAAAWVQAQLVEGRQGVGYNAAVLFQCGESVEEREEFFRQAKEQAREGEIKVKPPRALLAKWQAQGEGRSR